MDILGNPAGMWVSAVKTLRNGDFRLLNASPHSILRIPLNQCRITKTYCYTGNVHISVIEVTVSIDLGLTRI